MSTTMNVNQYITQLISERNISQIVNYIININDLHNNYRQKMIPVVKKELIDNYRQYQSTRKSFTMADVDTTNNAIIEHRTDDIIYNTITPNVKPKKLYSMPTIPISRYMGFDHDEDDGIHGSSEISQIKFIAKDKKWSRFTF